MNYLPAMHARSTYYIDEFLVINTKRVFFTDVIFLDMYTWVSRVKKRGMDLSSDIEEALWSSEK
jgi:hypothetical protein